MGSIGFTLLSVFLAAQPIKLAAVGFTQVGLSEAQAVYYAEHFSVKLAEDPAFLVTSSKDLAAIVGLERQKAMLGCTDTSSTCVAELAGALGVDGLVTGQIARVGQSFQLSVKVLAVDGSKPLFVHASQLVPTEERLLEEVTRIASLAAERLKERFLFRGEHPVEPASTRSLWRLAPTAAGVIAIAVGAALVIDSSGRFGALQKSLGEGTPPADFRAQVAAGNTQQNIGLAVGAIGAGASIAGILLFALAPAAPHVGAYVTPSGFGVNASWRLP